MAQRWKSLYSCPSSERKKPGSTEELLKRTVTTPMLGTNTLLDSIFEQSSFHDLVRSAATSELRKCLTCQTSGRAHTSIAQPREKVSGASNAFSLRFERSEVAPCE